MNISGTSKLSLTATAYEERLYLSHILNAVQVIGLFSAAIATSGIKKLLPEPEASTD
jgi:hypothetical protein